MKNSREKGMTQEQARTIEYSIIALCLLSLVLVFQPHSLELFGIGAGLVVVSGLAFNLIPFCRAGVPFSRVLRVAMIVVITLLVVAALAISSAWLYGKFFVGSP